MIKYAIPVVLLYIIGYALWNEVHGGLYGMNFGPNYGNGFSFMRVAPIVVLCMWFLGCALFGLLLTSKGSYADAD